MSQMLVLLWWWWRRWSSSLLSFWSVGKWIESRMLCIELWDWAATYLEKVRGQVCLLLPCCWGTNAAHHTTSAPDGQTVALYLQATWSQTAKFGENLCFGWASTAKNQSVLTCQALSVIVSIPTVQTCESHSCGRTRSTSKTKEVRVGGGCTTWK